MSSKLLCNFGLFSDVSELTEMVLFLHCDIADLCRLLSNTKDAKTVVRELPYLITDYSISF